MAGIQRKKGSHQRKDNHYTSTCNRTNFFTRPLGNRGTALNSVHIPLAGHSTDVDELKTSEKIKTTQKSQPKSRSISCQTVYREQSAQTKPYLPQIQYRPGVEKTELVQIDSLFEIDSPLELSQIKAINRHRKRLQCEQLLKQSNSLADEQRQVFETLEWQEWLTREHDIESTQSLRFRTVQETLKQRDKLFEIDSIKTIDQSVNRLNNEHKRQIESIK